MHTRSRRFHTDVVNTRSVSENGSNDSPERNAVILFADIIGASEVSNHKTPAKYYDFVREFQNIFRATFEIIKKEINPDIFHLLQDFKLDTRGDEGILIIYLPYVDPKPYVEGRAVLLGLDFALELKRLWVNSEENIDRIKNYKLLPVDIGVGIHYGNVHRRKEPKRYDKIWNPLGFTPEGYAINLAKRVETESRNGRYTNIFVSEAAYGALQKYPTEKIYHFDEQQTMLPKGISHKIPVFELKHYHLGSDWTLEIKPRVLNDELPGMKQGAKLLSDALKLNPTSIWLSETLIMTQMMLGLNKLIKRAKSLKQIKELKEEYFMKAFLDARETALQLTQNFPNDSIAILILGLVEGEQTDYESEKNRYEQAKLLDKNSPDIEWYEALSMSYQLDNQDSISSDSTFNDLSVDQEEKVKEIFQLFDQAISKHFISAWIPYDYACELLRWRRKKDMKKGWKFLRLAYKLLPDEVKDMATREPYLNGVRNLSEFKRIFAK